MSKKHTSIVEILVELNNGNIIKVHGYDDIADFIYRKIKRGDYVVIEGKLRYDFVEIVKVERI